MRVSCFQENLSKGLSIVGRAVSSRSTLPVLGNILLEAKDDKLRLAATNLEIGVNCWIGARIEDEGAITVPARLLTEFVNSLPPDKIDMELSVRTQTLHLRCGNFDVNIKGIDAQEFPVIPTVDNGDGPEETAEALEGRTIALETAGLTKMIDQVVFAAATDESRPTLTGVEVTFAKERLSLAATDGYRLSVRSIEVEEAFTDDLSVVVPARHLGELGRIIADAEDEKPVQVTVTQARNQILFRVWGKGGETRGAFHQVDLVSQLIADRFPTTGPSSPRATTPAQSSALNPSSRPCASPNSSPATMPTSSASRSSPTATAASATSTSPPAAPKWATARMSWMPWSKEMIWRSTSTSAI